MNFIVVVSQIALALILGVAALGKLVDPSGTRRAIADFGVPSRYAVALGTVLPILELVLALLVLPRVSARWAALGAMMLFIAFIAGIVLNLRLVRRPDCHCFGQFHSEPIGRQTILRNAVFAGMSAVIAWQGSPGPIAWFADLSELEQIVMLLGSCGLGLLAAQVWLSFHIWKQNDRIEDGTAARIGDSHSGVPECPSDGAQFRPHPAPPFDLPTLNGGRLTLQGLLNGGKPLLLLFVDPMCGPCRKLVPDIQEWHRRFSREVEIVLISRGDEAQNRDKFAGLTVGLQDDHEFSDRFGVEGTPTGVLIDRDGMIRSPHAPGRAEIRALLIQTTSQAREEAAANVVPADLPGEPGSLIPHPPIPGTVATRLPLPDLNGGYIGLDDLRGEPVLLLFFNPDCPFCQRMLPELQEWERDAGQEAQQVLIVSTGSVDANRGLDLHSRIVLDGDFTLGNAFGATGTPSAILIGPEGEVASPMLVGADAILDALYEQIEAPSEMVLAQ